jgi:hypothetical protein
VGKTKLGEKDHSGSECQRHVAYDKGKADNIEHDTKKKYGSSTRQVNGVYQY